MSLPRLVVPWSGIPAEGVLVPLEAEPARHLGVLRFRPGQALELLLPTGPWRADLALLDKGRAQVRLVGPLAEHRESPLPVEAHLPLTSQLALWDDWLPPLVELGVMRIVPIVYARSEFDERRTRARQERWQRILLGAVEQSHRGSLPELLDPRPFESLLNLEAPQRWVAYEKPENQPNPTLRREPLAFTSGPEGGITDGEYAALRKAGWLPVSLGRAILRAVTAPVALAGAIQFQAADWS